jgi:uncharacterized protein YutE (UPF0331/DUF86 family)
MDNPTQLKTTFKVDFTKKALDIIKNSLHGLTDKFNEDQIRYIKYIFIFILISLCLTLISLIYIKFIRKSYI